MRQLFKILSALVILTGLQASAETSAPTKKPSYTLIDNVSYVYRNNLDCEIAVAMASDRSNVRVLRLDHRKGVYSVNYFAKLPHLFNNYGIQVDLDDLFRLHGAVINTVQAGFDLKDDHYDLILKIQTPDPMTGVEVMREQRFSLETELFKDSPLKCLK
jgi:hypothetical protein